MAVSPLRSKGAAGKVSEPAAISPMEDDEDAPEEEIEARKPLKLPEPGQPTEEEIREHEITHMPPRMWCSHCVRGRAVSAPHFDTPSAVKEDKRLPTVSIDYFFMGSAGTIEFEESAENKDAMPMLAVKDHTARGIFAEVVPRKGEDQAVVRRLRSIIDFLGYKRLLFKSDQEAAILALKRRVSEEMPQVEFLMEESPVGDSRANGTIEVAVREVGRLVRTLKDAVEFKCKVQIPSTHPILTWLVKHASAILTRYQVGKDGRTAWELTRGKPYRRKMLPFAEMVEYIPTKKSGERMHKLDARTRPGIFVGVQDRTDELIIMTETGMTKARTVYRKPAEERYNKDLLLKVKGTPWDPQPQDQDNLMLPKAINLEVRQDVPAAEPKAAKREFFGRSVYIRRKDVEKYGATSGCNAC